MNSVDLSQINPDRYYYVKEAVPLLGISRRTLERHTNENKIKCELDLNCCRRVYKGREMIKYKNNRTKLHV